MRNYDVVIIGAGAAGMMCALEAGQRGRSVLLVEHGKSVGEKIRISGGGRCNFTNLDCGPGQFLSRNKHFCISALKQYTAQDFISLVERHGIAYHEKTLGQLFCDGSSKEIIELLKAEMANGGVEVRLQTEVRKIEKNEPGFGLFIGSAGNDSVEDLCEEIACQSLVIATGGKSIPKMGASGFGYKVAAQFGVGVVETRPALVPLMFDGALLQEVKPLAGVGVDVAVSYEKTRFNEAMLFTHRGLSGPAILQISSFWREGNDVTIDLLPEFDVYDFLRYERGVNGKRSLQTVLAVHLPKRVVEMIAAHLDVKGNLADLSDKKLKEIQTVISNWQVRPVGTEGYRTAEVTLGGVDTNALHSKTMMVKDVEGLYFIGEVVDVTGWLGGYNFQWAWSSGWCTGQAV